MDRGMVIVSVGDRVSVIFRLRVGVRVMTSTSARSRVMVIIMPRIMLLLD
jgi:hypothetical protein